MDTKTLIQSLEWYARGGPKPTLPLPASIEEVVLKFPKETAEYASHRISHVFENKAEVGKHLEEFSALTGLSRHQLVTLNTNFGLQTKPYKSVRKRRERIKETYQTRLKILEALTEVIKGYGSVPEIAEKYGLTARQIYRLAHIEGKKRGFTLYDLRGIRASKRLALAMAIQKEVGAEIEEMYKGQIK